MQERWARQKHESAFYIQISGKTRHCSHIGIVVVEAQYEGNCLLAGIVLKPKAHAVVEILPTLKIKVGEGGV